MGNKANDSTHKSAVCVVLAIFLNVRFLTRCVNSGRVISVTGSCECHWKYLPGAYLGIQSQSVVSCTYSYAFKQRL